MKGKRSKQQQKNYGSTVYHAGIDGGKKHPSKISGFANGMYNKHMSNALPLQSPHPSFDNGHQQQQTYLNQVLDENDITDDGERTPLTSNLRSAEMTNSNNSNNNTNVPSLRHYVSQQDSRFETIPPPRDHYIPINGIPPNRLNGLTKASIMQSKRQPSPDQSVASSSSSSSASLSPMTDNEQEIVNKASMGRSSSPSDSTNTTKTTSSSSITTTATAIQQFDCHSSDPSNRTIKFKSDSHLQLMGGDDQDNHSTGSPRGFNVSWLLSPCSDRTKCLLAISLSCLALLLCSETVVSHLIFDGRRSNIQSESSFSPFEKKGAFHHLKESVLDGQGRYRIANYDQQLPFYDELSSTIVAGIYGKPLYAWFVNRGQAMAHVGVNCTSPWKAGMDQHEKDRSCSPILSAGSTEDTYATIAFRGFRTFLQFDSPRAASAQSALTRGMVPKTGVASSRIVEPFSPITSMADANDPSGKATPERNMFIGEGGTEVHLQEKDPSHGIETNITYYTLPEEYFGAMVRHVQITNFNKRGSKTFAVVDGLAEIQPDTVDAGDSSAGSGQHPSGYEARQAPKVTYPYDDSLVMAYYQSVPQNSNMGKENIARKNGHYCFSMVQLPGHESFLPDLLPIIYDTHKVFGHDSTMVRPHGLEGTSVSELIQHSDHGEAGEPELLSAFAALERITLKAGETVTITSIYGRANDIMDVPVYARRLLQEGFVDYKISRTRALWKQLTRSIETKTNHALWNAHVSQMFVDSSMMGGYPIVLGDSIILDDGTRTVDEDPRLKVFHIFSRSTGGFGHGLNDYNLLSQYFSQSGGIMGEVMDNRKNDVMFNPRIASFNVRSFLSFLHLDGFVPNKIDSVKFVVKNPHLCGVLAEQAAGSAEGHRAQREALSRRLEQGPYRPGELFQFIEEGHIKIIMSQQDFIDSVVAASDILLTAHSDDSHGRNNGPASVMQKEWTSLLSTIETYLAVFPDKEEWLLFEEQLPYLSKPKASTVNCHHHHYTMLHEQGTVCSQCMTDNEGGHVQTTKERETGTWLSDANDRVFKSTSFEKLFILAAVKFASRDPSGMGLMDMHSLAHGCDSARGLELEDVIAWSEVVPTYDLKNLLTYLQNVLSRYPTTVTLPAEVTSLVDSILDALEKKKQVERTPQDSSDEIPAHLLEYWTAVSSARRDYLLSTEQTFRGWTVPVRPGKVLEWIEQWIEELDGGISQAGLLGTGNGLDSTRSFTPTYFSFKVNKWNATDTSFDGDTVVEPVSIQVKAQPLFLDGAVAQLSAASNPGQAQNIFNSLKSSPLYDEKLSTYRRCFDGADSDIQCWLPFDVLSHLSNTPLPAPENAIISTDILYKLYNQMLKLGLYDTYFDSMATGGMLPVVDPEAYGRPIVEMTSMIVASNAPNTALHGRGIYPEAATAPAHIVSLWIQMMIGPNPFFLADSESQRGGKELQMRLQPSLPLWMFQPFDPADETNSSPPHSTAPRVTFTLFSSIEVHYYNERNTDIFGIMPTRYRIGLRDGSVINIPQSTIPSNLAENIRRVVFVEYIEAYFE